MSALQYYSDHLYIGLVTGEVLVLAAPTLNLLTILHCHRSHVRSFLAIDLKKLLPNPTQSPAFTPALSPSHPFLITDDNTVTYKTGPIQLMSFGTGFRYVLMFLQYLYLCMTMSHYPFILSFIHSFILSIFHSSNIPPIVLIYPSTHHLSIHQTTNLHSSIRPSVRPSIHPSIHLLILSTHLFYVFL